MVRGVRRISPWSTTDRRGGRGGRKFSGNLRRIKRPSVFLELLLEIYFDPKTHKCLV